MPGSFISVRARSTRWRSPARQGRELVLGEASAAEALQQRYCVCDLRERFEKSDGLGAIYPAMLNSIVALRCLDYSLDDPQMIRAMDEFEKLGIDCPDGSDDYPTPTFRMQPCFPPVWDTAQALYALGEAGCARTIRAC